MGGRLHNVRVTVSRRLALVLALALGGAGCGSDGRTGAEGPLALDSPTATSTSVADRVSTPTPADGEVVQLRVEVIGSVPHEPSSYTQGLIRTDDGFVESVGRYGSSELRVLDPDGTVSRRVALADDLFGEGIELIDDQLVQLTWRAERALVYDATTLEPEGEFTYRGEGWGLCARDDEILMSDGSSTLTVRDPHTFDARTTVAVRLGDQPVDQLNELACVGDTVWANVWKQEIIVGIDAASGAVHSVVDASGLHQPADAESVLNGIAHDPVSDTFWLTGKNWPELFQVRFVPAA